MTELLNASWILRPGLQAKLIYDFGDMVRLGASTARKDARNPASVRLDLKKFESLSRGYLAAAKDFIQPGEVELLGFSCRLMCLNMTVRFLTDYLDGDIYFTTRFPNHNLARMRTQMKMVSEFEANSAAIEEMVKKAL